MSFPPFLNVELSDIKHIYIVEQPSSLFISKRFYHPELQLQNYKAITTHSPLPKSPGNHYSSFLLYEFGSSRSLYKEIIYYLSICDYIILFNIMFYDSSMLSHIRICFFSLRLKNILFHIYTALHMCSLGRFIHVSIIGHLGCFHLWLL